MGAPDGTVAVDEAASLLGVSRQRVYTLISEGRLAAVRSGGRLWVPTSSIEARRAQGTRLHSNDCITVAEVADFFGVYERTVREWHRRGLLRALRIHNQLCFATADVVAFEPPFETTGRPAKRTPTRTIRGRHFPPDTTRKEHSDDH